jgi:hypothetical protein
MNRTPIAGAPQFSRTTALTFLLGLLLAVATACRTAAPLPPANLAEPGWRMRHGQVLWTARRGAPEVAGELVLATHRDGRSVAQFVKTPFPVVVAQTTTRLWQIHFVPQNRTFSGNLPISSRFAWLQLPAALAGHSLPADYEFGRPDAKFWRLENRRTGEVIEGYLLP